MRTIVRLSAILAAVFICATATAQNKGNDVFVPISKYLSQGNVDALSAWFAGNLEVTIMANGGDTSRNQAKQVMKTFFDSYTPRDFKVTHTAGTSNMKYVLGVLNAGGENFHVTMFVICKDGAYQIQQIKIDKQQ